MAADQKCETVEVRVVSGVTTIFNDHIPAYTRQPWEVEMTVTAHLANYLMISGSGPVSVGDFALYLVAQAAREPWTHPRTKDGA